MGSRKRKNLEIEGGEDDKGEEEEEEDGEDNGDGDESSEEEPEDEGEFLSFFAFGTLMMKYSRFPCCDPNFGTLQRCHGLYEYNVGYELDRFPIPAL